MADLGRPRRRLVVGDDGPVAIVSGKPARLISLRLANWRTEIRGHDQELDAALHALAEVGLVYVSMRDARRTGEHPPGETVALSSTMDTAEAAALCQRSQRWVQKRVGDELTNVGTARRFLFERGQVELLAETRGA